MMNKNNHKNIYIMFAALSVIAIIFSIIILVQKTSTDTAVNNICSAISPSSQCEVVQNSKYGKILGIDNPWYGIIGFSILAVLAVMQYYSDNKYRRYLIAIGSLIAGMLALWFLYLQRFVLQAYCIFCIFVDIISIIMLGLAVYILFTNNIKRKNREKK